MRFVHSCLGMALGAFATAILTEAGIITFSSRGEAIFGAFCLVIAGLGYWSAGDSSN